MNGVEPTENRAIMYGDVPGTLSGVGDHHVVAYVAVMGQVHVRHDEAPRSDGGFESRGGAAVDRGVLANDGALTNLDPGFLAIVLEVLRVATEHRSIADQHVFRQTHVLLQGGARSDAAAIAHRHAGSDDREGTDGDAFTQLG